jgi:small nuclear ribonucleoprotein (snRNP)-like protein
MKKILTTIAVSLLATTAMASEVYIDQAGGSLNVNVLQENGNNRINTEANPMDVDGNDITLDITQSGDANEADLEFDMGADSTTFTYSATGDYNTMIGEIYGGIDNSFTATIVGSENLITYCKDYTNSVCNGIIVNGTTTTATITGNDNQLNLALDSADSTNSFDIGSNTPSGLNVTNLTQISTGGFDAVTMTMDGDSNTTNITQNTTGGNNTVTATVTGSSNTTTLEQLSAAGYDTITMTIDGSTNTTTMEQNSTSGNNSVLMDIIGSTNTVAFTQTGAGGYNQIDLDITGSSNTMTFDQQTAIGDTRITGVVTGDSNTVTILQN